MLFLFVFLYLIVTEEGAGHSLAGLGRGPLSLIAFWIRLHCRCKEILQVEESGFFGLNSEQKTGVTWMSFAPVWDICIIFTSSSSSSNNDKAALLVLLWLDSSGLDWLLGMVGNSYQQTYKTHTACKVTAMKLKCRHLFCVKFESFTCESSSSEKRPLTGGFWGGLTGAFTASGAGPFWKVQQYRNENIF